MIVIDINERDQTIKDTKQTIVNTLSKWDVLEYTYNNNTFKVKIKDYKTFNEILRLFYYLYILEKMHSHRYPVPRNGESDKRHLKSTIEKDKQAYILKMGEYTVFVTYFGYHKSNINPFDKKRLLVGDFKNAFKKIGRPSYTTSPSNCPVILMFRYHLSEKSNIIVNLLNCSPSIDFSKLTCEISDKGECKYKCLEEIETAILSDLNNIECNLRIFGGTPSLFKVNYDIIENLINLEFFNKRGYEPIFNFLLGCYISDKIEAEFNSNVEIRFDGITIIDDVDIFILRENEVIIVETTREHQVHDGKKLKDVIRNTAVVFLVINNRKVDKDVKYILITLTPESDFNNNQSEIVSAINKLFKFIHIGIPDHIAKQLKLTVNKYDKPEFFSPSLVYELLLYQLDNFLRLLSTS